MGSSMTQADPRDVAQRMARFERVCREAGVRLTHQRMEIFREVARADDHPNAETVYRRVRRRMPTVSLDTVYRTLWLLNDHDLITTLGPSRERTRFDANLTRHHHFVCVRCGSTRDFYSEELDDLELPTSAKALGRIETTLVEVRGICRECSRKAPSPPTSARPTRPRP
jgi:Fur family peroxide stress response transcriptional regulator